MLVKWRRSVADVNPTSILHWFNVLSFLTMTFADSRLRRTKTLRLPNADRLLGQRLRRWANSYPALVFYLVFAGVCH